MDDWVGCCVGLEGGGDEDRVGSEVGVGEGERTGGELGLGSVVGVGDGERAGFTQGPFPFCC